MSTPPPIVDEARFRAGIIEPDQFVADTEAFLDVRIARSKGKASYSMIGPGVSQNAAQTINLSEPHGFNVGAASMPSGVVNNPHLHYGAEVFICTRGAWRFAIGEHGEQTMEIGADTVFAAPSWVFRGFTNVGEDDGWLFVVLGGDDTGGILWAPHILDEAAETGLYLAPDQSVIECVEDTPPVDVVRPVPADELDVDRYTDDELEAHVVRPAGRRWSEQAFLSSVLDGHRVALAPVLGHGLSQDRRSRPPVAGAHGFSVEWLRIEPGQRLGEHRVDNPVVLLCTDDGLEVSTNLDDDRLTAEPAAGSVVSFPAGAWRDIRNTGPEPAEVAVVSGGDQPTKPVWSDHIIAAARAAGWTCDVRGNVAPIGMLARPR